MSGGPIDIDKTQPGSVLGPSKWHFDYDPVNRLSQKTDPNGFVTRYEYDAVGNLVTLDEPDTPPNRLVTRFQYDALDRPTSIVRPDESVTIAYDDGQPNQAAGGAANSFHGLTMTIRRPGQPDLVIVRKFDALERLVDETVGANTTSYQYDAASNVRGVFLTTAATGRIQVLAYGYDTRTRVTSIQDTRANRTVQLVYDAASQLTKVTYPSGVTKSLTYGLRGEITDIVYATSAGSTIRSLHYVYDDALQLKEKDDQSGSSPAVVTNFSYDKRGQLTAVAYADGTSEAWTYDAAGNIATYTSATVSETRFHDAADQLRLISRKTGAVIHTIQITYDARGNVQSRIESGATTQAFAWDSQSRMLSVGLMGQTTTIVAAQYGDDYRLISLQSGTSPAITPIFSLDNILTELANPGSTEQNFLLSLPGLDNPLDRGPPASTFGHATLLTDILQTAIATLDDTGAVVQTTDYLGYGGVRAGTDPGSIGFAGGRRDPASGLVWLRHRWYSPELGRFLSRDPTAFAGSFNLYAYGGGRPSRFRDPLGLWEWADVADYIDDRFGDADRAIMNYGAKTANASDSAIASAIAGGGTVSATWSLSVLRIISPHNLLRLGWGVGEGWGELENVDALVGPGSDRASRWILMAGAGAKISLDGFAILSTLASATTLAKVALSRPMFQVGPFSKMPRPRPSGCQAHHGVNSVWMREFFSDYEPGRAPAILMPNDPSHNATRVVFNRVEAEIAARQGVAPGQVDWSQVSPGTAWRLSEEQIEAAGVPKDVSDEYFRQFNEYISRLKRR